MFFLNVPRIASKGFPGLTALWGGPGALWSPMGALGLYGDLGPMAPRAWAGVAAWKVLCAWAVGVHTSVTYWTDNACCHWVYLSAAASFQLF